MDDPDDGASEKSVSQRILSASARARKALARMLDTDMDDGGSKTHPAGKQTAENGQSLADRAARVQARDDERANASEGAAKGTAAAATKSNKSVQQLPRARVGSFSESAANVFVVVSKHVASLPRYESFLPPEINT
jgi:hypothetical protein